MKQVEPWRDRAPKVDPRARCCWVCGQRGGFVFTMALRWAGYRMKPGEMGYAHDSCMAVAAHQQREREHQTIAM
jgi:hypothetical protein